MTVPSRITVHIEQIVVEGAAVRSRVALVEAFRQELAQLITQAPAGLGPARAVHRVDAGAAVGDLTADPGVAGLELARAVFGALRPGVRHG